MVRIEPLPTPCSMEMMTVGRLYCFGDPRGKNSDDARVPFFRLEDDGFIVQKIGMLKDACFRCPQRLRARFFAVRDC